MMTTRADLGTPMSAACRPYLEPMYFEDTDFALKVTGSRVQDLVRKPS